MTNPGQRRILIVEDERNIAEPLRNALEREGFAATIATTARNAIASAEQEQPDLILLDLMLPDGDGRDVCRQLRATSRVPVIMVTARGSETDRVVGLEIGADDYIVKPFSTAEVLARVRAVLRRTDLAADPEPNGMLEVGALTVDPGRREASLDGQPLRLSRREFDLLAELARNAGSVVRRQDLMDRIWGQRWFGSDRTLDVHVSALRSKLGEKPAAPRYLKTVRGVGFILDRSTGP